MFVLPGGRCACAPPIMGKAIGLTPRTEEGAQSVRRSRRRRGPEARDQVKAKASKLEHSSIRPAAVTARKRSAMKSLLRMVHLPMTMLYRID